MLAFTDMSSTVFPLTDDAGQRETHRAMSILTNDDLYVLLYEECAELIKAAAKCQRFGPERNYPGYGVNAVAMAHEVGDVLGVLDELQARLGLDVHVINTARHTKIERAEKAKRDLENEHLPGTGNL